MLRTVINPTFVLYRGSNLICRQSLVRFGSTTDSSSVPPATVYTGPFAGVTLRLKRVSVMTASIGLFGMPLLVYLNTGEVRI